MEQNKISSNEYHFLIYLDTLPQYIQNSGVSDSNNEDIPNNSGEQSDKSGVKALNEFMSKCNINIPNARSFLICIYEDTT